MKAELKFRTIDHPEANGRKPVTGDTAHTLRFPLEGGEELVIELGEHGFQLMTQQLFDMLTNAPSYNDGSTNEPPTS